jgi:RNA polymerase sigma-70 factor (ECF subfamily)
VADCEPLFRLGDQPMSDRAQEIARCLAAARAGSPDSLGQALEACRGYLLLIAQQEIDPQLRAKEGASDLVQETFLKAHRHFAQFHGDVEEELLGWLRRMLLNNLADFRRFYCATQKRHAGREVSLEVNDSSRDRGGALAAAEPTPSAMAIGQEQAEELQRVLARLPEDYQQVLLLRHQGELSFEEIGRRMNRSANAVRKLWARAVERLQEEWEKRS